MKKISQVIEMFLLRVARLGTAFYNQVATRNIMNGKRGLQPLGTCNRRGWAQGGH